MKKLLTVLFISISIKSYSQKSVDTISVSIDARLPKKLSDSIGAFETEWRTVKLYDTANRVICVEKQLYKLSGSQDVYIRKRRTVYVNPTKSRKQAIIDSLLETNEN